MERKVIHLSRRQLLLGAAGFTLALPVLPSILQTSAYGADPTFVRRPRLFWLTSNHGAAHENNLFPSESLFTEERQLFDDHAVKAGPLKATIEGSRARLSAVLQADSALLSERRIGQLNVIRGLDIPFSIAHHTGGHLGNYHARDLTMAGPPGFLVVEPRPTIDQILAWSSTFYDDLDGVRERAIVVGPETISWNYSNPSAQAGEIQNVRGEESSVALFNRLFVPTDAPAAMRRRPVVDHVLESYHRLRNGNRRLSGEDRQRLDDHMDRVAELQRKLGAGAPAFCASAAPPADDARDHLGADPADAARHAQLFQEVVALAFLCGSSRVAVVSLPDDLRFGGYAGDWHNEVAHEWLSPDKQALLVSAYQRVFENVFLDMVARLDAEEAPGMTYLDNSLLVWTHESGMSTHDPVSMPVVTAGSAAGFLNTGLSLDYRRVGHPDSRFDPQADGYLIYAGLPYNRFLATVLQAMGLSSAEFERWGHKGYGYPVVDPPNYGIAPFESHYKDTTSRYFQTASDLLPFLEA